MSLRAISAELATAGYVNERGQSFSSEVDATLSGTIATARRGKSRATGPGGNGAWK